MYNFTFHVPTRIYFGKGQIKHLPEIAASGSKTLLVYGGGSIKRAGIYDQALELLKGAGVEVFELPGVEPNPKIETVRKGAELCKKEQINSVLAIGGGSTGGVTLTPAQQKSLDDWNRANPDMQMTAKEFLQR